MPAARITRLIKNPRKYNSNKFRNLRETGRLAGFLLYAGPVFPGQAVSAATQPLIFQGLRLCMRLLFH